MAAQSVSFDDDSDDELFVFSGNDLLTVTTTWPTSISARSLSAPSSTRDVAQVAVLEDLIDEFILYLVDPVDVDAYQAQLDRLTIGPRVRRLMKLLRRARMFDSAALAAVGAILNAVDRRNELAHGTIHCRPVEPVEPGSWIDGTPREWIHRQSPHSDRTTNHDGGLAAGR